MANAAPSTDAIPQDIAGMSFEQAMAELETIVQKLEGGAASLEASIDLYGRGSLLRRHCEAKLKAAQERVEKIVVGEAGAVGVEPASFD
jgi:exodeoxyribonuclease VII small subunit